MKNHSEFAKSDRKSQFEGINWSLKPIITYKTKQYIKSKKCLYRPSMRIAGDAGIRGAESIGYA